MFERNDSTLKRNDKPTIENDIYITSVNKSKSRGTLVFHVLETNQKETPIPLILFDIHSMITSAIFAAVASHRSSIVYLLS